MPGTVGLLQGVQTFMSEDVNFVGIDFDPFSGLKKTLKIPSCHLGKQLSHFAFLGPLVT